jgi:hypothetical protein
MIGSETFIMVAFMCSGEEHALRLGVGDFLFQEGAQGLDAHEGAVDHVAFGPA